MKCVVISFRVPSAQGIYKDFNTAVMSLSHLMTGKDKRNIRPLIDNPETMNRNGTIFNAEVCSFVSLEEK